MSEQQTAHTVPHARVLQQRLFAPLPSPRPEQKPNLKNALRSCRVVGKKTPPSRHLRLSFLADPTDHTFNAAFQN
jgi:hypothetical protein